MKLTKNQLKELVKEAILEKISEEDKVKVVQKKEKEGPKKASTDIKDNPFEDEDEKEKTDESVSRRFTVKEVQKWMKTLEENRYKKVYNADARRVAWMVNNEGVELSEMPKSMSKKWTKAQYGRERYLAKEFVKSKSEQMNESVWALPKGSTTTKVDELDAELSRAGIKSKPDFNRLLVKVDGNKSKINKIMKTHKAKKVFEQKLRQTIREIIKEQLNEAKMTNLLLPIKDRPKVVNILQKKLKLKITKDFEYGGKKGSNFVIELDKKFKNKFLELLVSNNIKVRG